MIDRDDALVVRDYITDVETWESETWANSAKRAVNDYLEWLHNHGADLSDTNARTIKRHAGELKRDGYADGSIQNRLGAIRSLCKVAVLSYDYDIRIDENDDKGIYGPDLDLDSNTPKKIQESDEDKHINSIEPDEVDKIIDACDSLRDRLLICTLWQTGVRAREASEITISDIERDKNTIYVDTLKSDSTGDDPVFFRDSLKPLLREWLDRGKRKAYTMEPVDDDGYLFVTRESAKMSPLQINRMVRRRADDAGIQATVYSDKAGNERVRVSAHTLRHSFAMARLRAGIPLPYLQDLLRHDNIRTTMRYISIDEDELREVYNQYQPQGPTDNPTPTHEIRKTVEEELNKLKNP